jgi:plasmid stabilization system protein ParE
MSDALPLRFTFLACADLRRIWDSIAMPTYVYEGNAPERLAQAQAFADRFSHHCELLSRNPELGAERNDLLIGIRALPFEKHVVWYRARGEVVEVVRVLRASDFG